MNGSFQLGEWRIEPHRNELIGPDGRERVHPRAMQVLTFLAERPGEVVARHQFLDSVWQGRFVNDEVLSVAVRELRRALGDDPKAPTFIQTFPGKGYCLIAPVGDVQEEAPKLRRRPAFATALAAGVVAAAVVAVAALWLSRAPPTTGPLVDSIAVLPFANLSGDDEQDYLAEGMTELLITELGQSTSLRVISRQSILRFRDNTSSLQDIARALDVAALVEGSILRDGDTMRVTVKLVRASPEEQLWSERFDRRLSDVLTIQGDLTREITRAVNVELAGVRPSVSIDPRAQEAYLRGRYFWSRLGGSIDRAIQYYEEAIAIEPDYALAYAGLADAYIVLGDQGHVPPRESFPLAGAAAEKALELDETLASAHASLGMVRLWHDWDPDAAEHELSRALELNPSNAVAHHWRAWLFATQGRLDAAVASMERARELDPLSPFVGTITALFKLYAGRPAEARIEVDKALELAPNLGVPRIVVGLIDEHEGKLDDALAHFEFAAGPAGHPLALRSVAHVHALAGRTADAHEVIGELSRAAETRWVSSFSRALPYAGLKDSEQALHWLEQAYNERDGWMISLAFHPRLRHLREEPRFMELIERVGVSQTSH